MLCKSLSKPNAIAAGGAIENFRLPARPLGFTLQLSE